MEPEKKYKLVSAANLSLPQRLTNEYSYKEALDLAREWNSTHKKEYNIQIIPAEKE